MVRKFTNAKVLSEKIDNFFDFCAKNDENPTVTRLAVALGSNRLGLIRAYNAPVRNSEDRKIVELLETALARVECWYEDALYDKETVQGAKFSLSANYGWTERNTTNITSDSAAPVAVRWMTAEEIAAASGRLDAPGQLRAANAGVLDAGVLDAPEQDAEEILAGSPRADAAPLETEGAPQTLTTSEDLAALL